MPDSTLFGSAGNADSVLFVVVVVNRLPEQSAELRIFVHVSRKLLQDLLKPKNKPNTRWMGFL